MNELALFAGAGGGILGGKLLGWRTVCAVEWDAYAASVLVARQNDGCLEPFPIWDDVQTFDGKPWRGRVDVVSGGFPCTDISCAGKGAGIDGEASGMWRHMARIIGEVRPRFVFVENSPMLTLRGLGRVLGDLSTLGFDARWGVVGAHHARAPHKRERIWIVADSHGWGQQERRQQNGDTTQPKFKTSQRNDACRCSENVADADGSRFQEQRSAVADAQEHQAVECRGWWEAEPDVGRVAHGVAARVDRLRCLGNGQVPAVAALAWQLLTSPPKQT